jgi:hypothetical protein
MNTKLQKSWKNSNEKCEVLRYCKDWIKTKAPPSRGRAQSKGIIKVCYASMNDIQGGFVTVSLLF